MEKFDRTSLEARLERVQNLIERRSSIARAEADAMDRQGHPDEAWGVALRWQQRRAVFERLEQALYVRLGRTYYR